MAEIAPPLWALPLAVAVVTILVVPTIWDYRRQRDRLLAPATAYNLDQLAAAAADRAAGAKIVIGVGNSTLRRAIGDDGAASNGPGPRVRVRVLYSNGIAVRFDSSVFAALVDLHPDAVVMQASVPFLSEPFSDRMTAWRSHLAQRLRGLFNPRRGVITDPETLRARWILGMRRIQAVRTITSREIDRWTAQNEQGLSEEPSEDYGKLITHCARAGIPVIYVPVPRRQDWGDRIRHLSEMVLANLATKLGVPDRMVWTCPEGFAMYEFQDPAHMLEPARQRFSQWLLRRLAEELAR